jgi:hypothetical protein
MIDFYKIAELTKEYKSPRLTISREFYNELLENRAEYLPIVSGLFDKLSFIIDYSMEGCCCIVGEEKK